MSRQKSDLCEQPGAVQSRLVVGAEIVSLVGLELRKVCLSFASRFEFLLVSRTSRN